MRGTTHAARVVRALVVVLLTAGLVASIPSEAAAAPSTAAVEVRLGNLINAGRVAAGLAPLRIDLRLVAAARSWSARMAGAAELSHDRGLAASLPPGTQAWGENVGFTQVEDAAQTLHDAFLASPAHLAHIMDPDFTELGVGARTAGETIWVTERFTRGAPVLSSGLVEPTAAAAREMFGNRAARHAVLVRDDAFPDALSAGPLAGRAGPILFSPPGPTLHPSVRLALEQVLPDRGTVYLLGGATAISSEVEAEIAAAGWTTRRVAGRDRVETAAAVARLMADDRGRPERVLLATAEDWPDAAAGSAYGARAGAPVLLSYADELPEITRRTLSALDPQRVIALGGEAVLSDRVVDAAQARRVSGDSREGTAVAIARVLWDKTEAREAPRWTLVPAANDAWGWALGAAPTSARRDAPVLLVEAPLAASVREYLDGLGYDGDTRGEADTYGPVDPSATEQVADLLR